MTLVENPLGQLRIVLHPVAAQQKGGVYPSVIKPVQQSLGVFAGGAVVEGQSHIFDFFGPDGQNQLTQAQDQRQKSSHENSLLSVDADEKIGYTIKLKDSDMN